VRVAAISVEQRAVRHVVVAAGDGEQPVQREQQRQAARLVRIDALFLAAPVPGAAQAGEALVFAPLGGGITSAGVTPIRARSRVVWEMFI
jgi:hypothetical protein